MIKIKYSEIKKKPEKELLKMKKTLKFHYLLAENRSTRRKKEFAPKEVKKNIARINKRLDKIKNENKF